MDGPSYPERNLHGGESKMFISVTQREAARLKCKKTAHILANEGSKFTDQLQESRNKDCTNKGVQRKW